GSPAEVPLMAFSNRRAAIVGVYTTEQARKMERSPFDLQREAILGVLDDAGLTLADVDGLAPQIGTDHHNASPMVNSSNAHLFWAETLGDGPMNVVVHGGAGSAVAKSAAMVAAGMADV